MSNTKFGTVYDLKEKKSLLTVENSPNELFSVTTKWKEILYLVVERFSGQKKF